MPFKAWHRGNQRSCAGSGRNLLVGRHTDWAPRLWREIVAT